ncbi:MAG: branched-chain amino acid ABC transporter permease [Tepidamorphaceae bacterium]|nr:branched-chain amino acid ABC transporter permease [Rhodobiaceae bacterium]MCC0049894.1 branched-chain amino acid ABC transporter permease [Rhodobiaceae bacterium]
MEAYLIAIAVYALVYLLMGLGLNLHYGFTGLINFGHVGFFAIGAYASCLLTLAGYPMPLGFALALLLPALAAIPIGYLSLRLRSDYLAIVTLGFSEVVRLAIINEKWLTNGVQGVPGIPDVAQGFGLPVSGSVAALIVLLIANALAIALVYRLTRSPFGRAIQAIRDDEEAVRALGKDPGSFKIRVFMIGASLAGLAGAIYGHYITYITPEQFLPLVTFYVWVAIILGGAGKVSGTIVGTLALMTFLEGSRFLRDLLPGVSEVEMASVRLFVIGLALILLVRFRPSGIMGDWTSGGTQR